MSKKLILSFSKRKTLLDMKKKRIYVDQTLKISCESIN